MTVERCRSGARRRDGTKCLLGTLVNPSYVVPGPLGCRRQGDRSLASRESQVDVEAVAHQDANTGAACPASTGMIADRGEDIDVIAAVEGEAPVGVGVGVALVVVVVSGLLHRGFVFGALDVHRGLCLVGRATAGAASLSCICH